DLLEVGLETGTMVLRIRGFETGARAPSSTADSAVVVEERGTSVSKPPPRIVDWSHVPALADQVPERDIEQRADLVDTTDVADILFTSGTTGRSKGAMSTHRQTIGVAAAWASIGGVDADDRYLVVNPFFHSFGYKIGIVVGLLTGATIYPQAVFDPEDTMRLVEQHRITLLPGAPTIYQSLLSATARAERDLSSLRLAITGAAVVPGALIERMRADPPAGLGIDNVFTAFGMTEAVVATMCREGDDDDLVARTCGRAIPGMETRIAGQGSNEALPAAAEGELLLRGDYVMLGYLDDEQATADAIDTDGWLRTGDIGRLDEAGNLTVTDRLKDMYISGGFNVYPAEVEQALTRLDGVADCAVIGVPDERLGEVGKAFVVRADGATLTQGGVVGFTRERLANFKVPKQVEFVDVIPRNLSGKVLKTALRQAQESNKEDRDG
ncbi:MAG: AMP-binding protein, partial [Actinomycetota bacterium]|nr:AMP-binding protein [Actinomycetota bacterium]